MLVRPRKKIIKEERGGNNTIAIERKARVLLRVKKYIISKG